jgi:hypothetical protein
MREEEGPGGGEGRPGHGGTTRRPLVLATLGQVLALGVSLGGCVPGRVVIGPGSTAAVVGSGRAARESRPVAGFREVVINGSGAATIRQGEAESLTIEADDNVLPLLTAEVRGEQLWLDLKPGTSIAPRTPIRYTVAVVELRAVEIPGSAAVEAVDLRVPAVRVDVSGSGSVVMRGTAERQDVEISGSGVYDGLSLAGREATVSVSGSGRAVVNVSDTLEVTISGSGAVDYAGGPQLRQEVSGVGLVRPI